MPIQGCHGSGNFYLAQKSGNFEKRVVICDKTSGYSDTFICSSFESINFYLQLEV